MNDAAMKSCVPIGGGSGQLMYSLIEVAHALQGRLEKALHDVGLSVPKYWLVSQLAESGEPLPLSELAAGQRCVRSNITQLVDRLEADGLVRRVDDPNDRRIVLAELTPLGLERQIEGSRRIEQVQTEFAASLPEGDRQVLVKLLGALK